MKILIVILITIHIICYLKYNKKLNNPYKLYMVFGKKGSGKSCYLCKIAKKYQKKGYTIYTNMDEMTLKGIRIINVENLGKQVPDEKSCIILDEVGMIYDNREYKNFRPEVRNFFKLQRHYKCVVYLASQTFDVDKKLRDLTDKMFLVVNLLPWLSVVKGITKKIAIVEASGLGESRIADNLKITPLWTWSILWIPLWVGYFDSFKAPELPRIEYKKKD